MFDPRAFRDALGCFATGVCVVTCRAADGTPLGVTVNSFSSVSLEPPLVLFSLDRAGSCCADFVTAPSFAVNVLSERQIELSRTFAQSNGGFAGIAFEEWDTGSPILPDCLSSLECDAHAAHDGGDHIILVGRVRRLSCVEDGQPLLYFRGRYSGLRGDV